MKFFLKSSYKNGVSIHRVLFLIVFSLSFLTLLTVSLLWVYTEIKRTKRVNNFITQVVLNEQKENLKSESETIIRYIKILQEEFKGMSEKKLRDKVLSIIEKIRFGYGGYIFINTYSGRALINDGKKTDRYIDMSKVIDPAGNFIFQMEKKAAGKPGGGFMHYYFKKIGGKIPQPKVAFIVSLPKWKWIIGAGDYIVDAKKHIANVTGSLNKRLKIKIMLIFFVFVVMSVSSYFVSRFFANYANKQLLIFLFHFQQNKNHVININKLKIKELIILAQKIKQIEDEKIKTEKNLKVTLDNMEEEIIKRTAELEKQNRELQRYNNLFVNREFRIKELRNEIDILLGELNKYKLKYGTL